MSTFDSSAHPPRSSGEAWAATRQQAGEPATQLMRDKEDYLNNAAQDIGRHVGEGQWELFVVSAPGEALQMQFDHQRPEFIAVHDVGTVSSRRLLAGLAAAMSIPVQTLVIRRQGYGVALATLEFVELPVPEGPPLRVYTTETDADTHSRQQLARVLLGHSRLGVVMVGDLPPHALSAALQPLRDSMATASWINRQLLMLPLASGATLAAQAAQLGAGRGVAVSTTPQVTRPAEAWSFISGTWNRLREQLAGMGTALPAIGAAAPIVAPATAPVAPLPMQPMPAVPRAGAAPAADGSPLHAYLQRCLQIKGMVSCCVFEIATRRLLAHAGARPEGAMLAAQGGALLSMVVDISRQLGLTPGQPDAGITLASHHIVLHPLARRPGLALHAVLDRSSANLTLARLQLQRVDEDVDVGQ